MSEPTTTGNTTVEAGPPPDAGLPLERVTPAGGGGKRRSGDELIAAAAKGEDLSIDESADLLDYFLTNGGLPGDNDPHPIEWFVGEGKSERKQVWHVRRIGWDEWTDAETRGRNEDTGEIDSYVVASWVVARALLQPALGPKVKALQEQASKSDDGKIDGVDERGNRTRVPPPEDAADLLRRMFRTQSGTLLTMSYCVRDISRLSVNSVHARTLDKEVAAGEA